MLDPAGLQEPQPPERPLRAARPSPAPRGKRRAGRGAQPPCGGAGAPRGSLGPGTDWAGGGAGLGPAGPAPTPRPRPSCTHPAGPAGPTAPSPPVAGSMGGTALVGPGPARAALASCAPGAAEAVASLQTGRSNRPARAARSRVRSPFPGGGGGGAGQRPPSGLRRAWRGFAGRGLLALAGLGRGREALTQVRISRRPLGKGFPAACSRDGKRALERPEWERPCPRAAPWEAAGSPGPACAGRRAQGAWTPGSRAPRRPEAMPHLLPPSSLSLLISLFSSPFVPTPSPPPPSHQ